MNRKIERAEERYMNEEIAQDLFVKYKQEKLDLLKKMQEFELAGSNHEEAVDMALDFSQNLSKMWHSGDYMKRQRLQYYLFPEGLSYNKKTDTVRTTKHNSVFLWITCQQQDLENKKVG